MSNAQILQLFGIYISAMGLGMLLNPEYFKKVFRDFAASPAAAMLAGVVATVAGYLLIVFKSSWIGGDILIAILGWVALVKGLALVLFPKSFLEISKIILRGKNNFVMTSIFCLALGIVFLYLGYLA